MLKKFQVAELHLLRFYINGSGDYSEVCHSLCFVVGCSPVVILALDFFFSCSEDILNIFYQAKFKM